LGSSFILQTGYAQTWAPRQIIDSELGVVNVSNRIQLPSQADGTVIRLDVQSEPGAAHPGLEDNGSVRIITGSDSGQIKVCSHQAIVRLDVQTETETAPQGYLE
jgi:hypothetical protein